MGYGADGPPCVWRYLCGRLPAHVHAGPRWEGRRHGHGERPRAWSSLREDRRLALTAQSVFHWFAAPELSRPELRRRARALWMVSWPFFAVVAVVLGIAVLVEPHT